MRAVGGDSGSWQIALLVCGVIAPLLHLATDWIAGASFSGYDFSAHSISDLGSIGSPMRSRVILLTLVASVLVFFPNTLGVRPAFGTPGVILMFLAVLCSVLAMLAGAFAFDGWMRWISMAVPVSYVVLAISRYATVGAENTTTLIGAEERTMPYSHLLWMLALAVHLLLSTGVLSRLTSASS